VLLLAGAAGGYFQTSGGDASVLLRLKEDYDGAEPAASSVAATNLLRLAALMPKGGKKHPLRAYVTSCPGVWSTVGTVTKWEGSPNTINSKPERHALCAYVTSCAIWDSNQLPTHSLAVNCVVWSYPLLLHGGGHVSHGLKHTRATTVHVLSVRFCRGHELRVVQYVSCQ
jgi:hypothetical protein